MWRPDVLGFQRPVSGERGRLQQDHGSCALSWCTADVDPSLGPQDPRPPRASDRNRAALLLQIARTAPQRCLTFRWASCRKTPPPTDLVTSSRTAPASARVPPTVLETRLRGSDVLLGSSTSTRQKPSRIGLKPPCRREESSACALSGIAETLPNFAKVNVFAYRSLRCGLVRGRLRASGHGLYLESKTGFEPATLTLAR